MLVVTDSFLPCSLSYAVAIGNLAYSKTLQLRDRPHALAAALWIIGYIAESAIHYYCVLDEVSLTKSHDPILLTDHEGSTLSNTPLRDFQKAKAALVSSNIILTKRTAPKRRFNERGEVYFENHQGTQYELHKSQFQHEFKIQDRIEIPIPEYKPIKKKVTKRKKTIKRKKPTEGKKTKITPPKIERHIFQLLPHIPIPKKLDEETKYTFFTKSKEVRLSSDKLFEDLDKCSYGQLKITHGQASKGMRLVFGFIDLMRRFKMSEGVSEMFADLEGIPTHVMLPEDYCELSQKFIGEQLSTGGQTPSTKAIVKSKNVIIDQLGWVEVEPSAKGGQSYLAGEKSIKYRFTDKFYDGTSNDQASEQCYNLTTTFSTECKALATCSLDSSVYKVFDEVAKNRGWSEKTKKIQREKLDDFSYNRGYFSQPRPASRVYTEVGSLPREFRKYVLIDGEETEEIDIKSAHPLFVAYFMGDENAKSDWITLISQGDIYLDIIDQFGLSHDLRTSFKKLFNAFLNGGGRNAYDEIYKLDVDFGEHMKTRYPFLYETVTQLGAKYGEKNKNNGAALILQELESHIMGTHFMCHSEFECISIHDGLLCKKSDTINLIEAAKKRGKEILNFDICVEKK